MKRSTEAQLKTLKSLRIQPIPPFPAPIPAIFTYLTVRILGGKAVKNVQINPQTEILLTKLDMIL